jgi:hypothetical protein
MLGFKFPETLCKHLRRRIFRCRVKLGREPDAQAG